jgi:pyridoxamine 5'-phosphate oxidase
VPSRDLQRLGRDFDAGGLSEAALDPDPIVEFGRWFAAVIEAGAPDPNAMILATADAHGMPSARTVLLKAVDQRGFVFYTNRTSRKGCDLAANPRAALVFPWFAVRRQVTVSGAVEVVADEEADAYFASRPRASQLGAWASRQSAVIADRATLDGWLENVAARFDGGPVPRPPFWGGYRVVPTELEFWQGRADRLHDRLRYRRDGGEWNVARLAP